MKSLFKNSFRISASIGLMLFVLSGFSAGHEKLFETYCFECHDGSNSEGDLNLEEKLWRKSFDSSHVFEKLITGEMPPADSSQPSKSELGEMLRHLADSEPTRTDPGYRRISRNEFNFRVNDLLGIDLDVSRGIADDRGTFRFDSDRRIQLTKEMMTAYFDAADKMLEQAFPRNGFLPESTWKTNKLKDSHQTYNIYTRPYLEGTLFSWTRANNGNSYSFFYDGFEPPISGWYEFTFDAAKVGDFEEDVSIQVNAGKYYFADDRPQPQRLLDVISLSNKKVKSFRIRGFMRPGENVSVHCFSQHTWRKKNTPAGAYIRNVMIKGPLYDWPPRSFKANFKDVKLNVPSRPQFEQTSEESILKKIGGTLSVSSFQKGMEKEKMLDGSNRTFWHTRFSPTLAKPPHYVVLENPNRVEIQGLSYSTWSGGNGNGQVTGFEIYASDKPDEWGRPIQSGKLETRLAAQQPIVFTKPLKSRYFKFLVNSSFSIDGRSLASIGKLDVLADVPNRIKPLKIAVVEPDEEQLKKVIRRFADRAFATQLDDAELKPYFDLSLEAFRRHGDLIEAAKAGFKAVICSHRFLLVSNSSKPSLSKVVADLAQTLWLSIPDDKLLALAKKNRLTKKGVFAEIDRLLEDPKSNRMIRAFSQQWLNLRTFRQISPSLKLYPLYDDLLDFYLPKETESFLRHLIVNNLPTQNLIDADFSILNQRLAQHYGIDGVVGQNLRKVQLPANSPRGGLLTMGSILKITTDGFQTSPILRGAWVSQRLAGNTLSPPPESVKAIEPDTTGAKTLREQILLHKHNETCNACHKNIDPFGFALESFDATGQWRDKYQIEIPHQGTFQYRRGGYFKYGSEADSSGAIGDTRFENVKGLKKILLANHKKIAYNFMKQFFEFANGYQPSFAQRIALFERIPGDSAECKIKDMIKEVLAVSFLDISR